MKKLPKILISSAVSFAGGAFAVWLAKRMEEVDSLDLDDFDTDWSDTSLENGGSSQEGDIFGSQQEEDPFRAQKEDSFVLQPQSDIFGSCSGFGTDIFSSSSRVSEGCMLNCRNYKHQGGIIGSCEGFTASTGYEEASLLDSSVSRCSYCMNCDPQDIVDPRYISKNLKDAFCTTCKHNICGIECNGLWVNVNDTQICKMHEDMFSGSLFSTTQVSETESSKSEMLHCRNYAENLGVGTSCRNYRGLAECARCSTCLSHVELPKATPKDVEEEGYEFICGFCVDHVPGNESKCPYADFVRYDGVRCCNKTTKPAGSDNMPEEENTGVVTEDVSSEPEEYTDEGYAEPEIFDE